MVDPDVEEVEVDLALEVEVALEVALEVVGCNTTGK